MQKVQKKKIKPEAIKNKLWIQSNTDKKYQKPIYDNAAIFMIDAWNPSLNFPGLRDF